jgi:hypothetical protein
MRVHFLILLGVVPLAGCDAIFGISDRPVADQGSGSGSSSGSGTSGASGTTSETSGAGAGSGTASGSGSTSGEGGARDADGGSPESAPQESGAEAGPTCPSGDPCVPSECHLGQSECDAGTAQCASKGPASDGTSCGDAGSVCANGACTACSPGLDCSEAGSCQAMTIDCSSGPACKPQGNKLDGTPCGTNLYCNAGNCKTCTNGAPCAPSTNPCHQGTVSCVGGAVVCTDTGNNADAGTPCDVNKVCNGGQCVACTSGASCDPGGNVCQTGATSCASGQSVCVAKGNVSDGTHCNDNNACTINDQCTSGTCAGTAPGCNSPPTCYSAPGTCNPSTGACSYSPADGTPCGTNMTCGSGVCQCSPGFTNCGTVSAPNCKDLANDNTNCGSCGAVCANQVVHANGPFNCVSSSCMYSTCTLAYTLGGPNGTTQYYWLDCDGNKGNGCEADPGSNTSCGYCPNVCTPPGECNINGQPVGSCMSGQTCKQVQVGNTTAYFECGT